MPAKKTTAKVDWLRQQRERQFDEYTNNARQDGKQPNKAKGQRVNPKGNKR